MRFSIALLSAAVVACSSISSPAFALDLLDIYKEAYAHDPVVQQAKANRDYYYAAIDEATAKLLPQIDVTGSLQTTNTNVKRGSGVSASNSSATAGISLSQVIWQHSAWLNRSIAEKQAVRYDLAYKDAMQNLIIRVATAYFNILDAADTLAFNKANNQALKRQLDEANRQFQVGVIAETDRLQAQASYDLSNASVIAAENALQNSYEEVRALTGHGITLNQLSTLDTDKFSTPDVKSTLQSLIKKAEGNNLSLQQYAVARDVAKDQISLAMTGHEPTVSLKASAETGYTNYRHEIAGSSQTDGNDWAQTIGINLTVPIYHGGETSAKVKEAEAKYVDASEALEAQHRTLVTNVTNNFNNVNAAISSVKAYEQSVISAQSSLDATQAGYEVGTRTMTDVLDAIQKLYSAKQKAAASRYTYIKSRLNLNYSTGELKLDDMEQVNKGLKK
ncbi:MAG: TolC family outer membrane protein [Succinivibrio sp.]|nr:TolC family outer membrane protein [Succinivibrio sp.]